MKTPKSKISKPVRSEALSDDAAPLVSVIIPVYNGAAFLGMCLKSVEAQTYRNLEILLIDDGSTDSSLDLIRWHAHRDGRVRYLSFENHGQGFARNRALEIAQGDYILFVDADDEIEPVAIEVAVDRALEDDSDFVLFTYKYFRKPKQYIYNQVESFFGCRVLEGDERFELLDCKAYYSVTRLYRKKLLDDFSIRYSEGHLYEDNAVCLATVLSAKRVSIVHSPLYNIRISATSSTRSDHGSSKHAEDYLAAVAECVSLLEERMGEHGMEAARYCYIRYAVRKFMEYYYRRVPKNLRRDFADRFLALIARLGDFPVLKNNDKLLRLCCSKRVFEQRRVALFRMLVFYMKRIRPKKGEVASKLRGMKNKAKKVLASPTIAESGSGVEPEGLGNVVLFMGFDFRYAGSSRYLFERFISEYDNEVTCYFVTEDSRVDEKYRLEPYSAEFSSVLRCARVAVFESWIPGKIKKPKGCIWVQLWHGDPIKKMLFDSDEKEIFAKNRMSKTRHYADIRRWDFFVAESRFFGRVFQTSFLMPKGRFIFARYPRVQYLIDHADDEQLRCRLAESYGLDPDKKTVLYLPTWRDYNYGKEESACDFSYRLDCNSLQDVLGDGYQVAVKGHNYLGKSTGDAQSLSQECETQELLLIADCVVTDYSSVVFDAAAIGKKILLYCTDFDDFQASRGVYPLVWKHLAPFVRETEAELAEAVRSYPAELAAGVKRIADLASDEYGSEFGIERTILRFAQDRRLPARSVLIARNAVDVTFGLKALEELFGDCGANNCIVAYDAAHDEAENLRDQIERANRMPYAMSAEARLAGLLEEFWVDRIVVCSGDVPEDVAACARQARCDCFSIRDCIF